MDLVPGRRRGARAHRHLLFVAASAVLAGCGPGSSASTAGPEVTVAAPTVTTAAGAPSATPPTIRPTPASPPAPGRCTGEQLDVVLGAQIAGAGHRGVPLVFRNRSGQSCWVRGWPGVDGLDRAGKTLAHAKRTTLGYLGGIRGDDPARVLLAPGDLASAMVEALGFRAEDGGPCEPYATLLVTPPDETRSVRLRWTTDSCSALEVHPLVPGGAGRST